MHVVDLKITVVVDHRRGFCLTQHGLWLTIKLGCGILFDSEWIWWYASKYVGRRP